MSGILVPSKTAALLGQAQAIFEGKAIRRTRRIPQFLPDGTEVKTVEQVAAMMRVDSITAALYVNEQKSSVPFRLGVEAKSVLLQYGGYEVKDIVRSAAGVRKYGQPIGSIIIADVTLPNLKVIDEPYEGWLTVQGDSGETYEVGLDEDATGKWVACRLPGGWDDVVIEGGKNRDDVLKKLSKHDLADMPKAPKLSKREENDIAWFNDKERGIYDQARLDGDDHEEALNTAQWEGLTNSQSNAIRNLDTLVRDWYWDLRADEADHATALRKVKALDKVMGRDDFDARKYYAAKKKNGAVSAADDAIAGEFTPDAPNGRRPTSPTPSKPRRGDSSAFRDPNPPRGGARAAQARTVANQTGGKKPVQRGTFHHGPNSATSSNAGARARAMTTPKTGFDPKTLKRSGMPIAGTVKPGDIVAPRWAADYPARVVKVGPVTGTGRVTIYYEDEKGNKSRQTYKINERLISFTEAGGSPKGGSSASAAPKNDMGVTTGDKVTMGQARSRSLVYEVVSVNGDKLVIADSNGTRRSVRADKVQKVGGAVAKPAPVTLTRTRKNGAQEVEYDGAKYTFVPGDGWGSGWRRGWSEDGPTIGLSDPDILKGLRAWEGTESNPKVRRDDDGSVLPNYQLGSGQANIWKGLSETDRIRANELMENMSASAALKEIADSTKRSVPTKVGDHDHFKVGNGSITVGLKANGEWYTRQHTGRMSARGTLYHHIKRFDSYEAALAHAKYVAGVK